MSGAWGWIRVSESYYCFCYYFHYCKHDVLDVILCLSRAHRVAGNELIDYVRIIKMRHFDFD